VVGREGIYGEGEVLKRRISLYMGYRKIADYNRKLGIATRYGRELVPKLSSRFKA